MTSLIEAITTIGERDNLMEFLEQFSQVIFDETIDVKSYILESAPHHVKEIIVSFYEDKVTMGKQAVVEEIENAEHTLKNMPVVELTVAFVPTIELARSIKSWFQTEMNETVILSFLLEKRIIGGAIVESDGRRVEYSFRQYFKNRKEGQR